MQLKNVLLMTAVILFSCNDAAASSPQVSTISAADAVQPNPINQRFLRSDYDSEERAVILPNFTKLDDEVVDKLATKLLDKDKLKAALGKTSAREALFKEVNAVNPAVRKEFLAKLAKSDEYHWLLPHWLGFKLKSMRKVEANEIKNAIRAGNAVS